MDDIPLWEGIGITCCIILSSFFSGAETALTSLTLVKIKQILNELGAKSSSLKLWEQRPNRVLITVLIGNNLANIAASALATNVTYRYFPNKAVAIAVFIMTFIILIFGEIIPKTYARSNADKLVVSIMRVLRFFYYFFYPIHVLLFNFSRLVIILMGGKLPKAQTLTTRDLELLIDLSHKEGVLEKGEEELLHSVMEFGDIMTKEILVPRTDMAAIDVNNDFQEMVEFLLQTHHSRIPVFRENMDNIIGILYAKDLIKIFQENFSSELFKITRLLRPAYFVPETKKISELLEEFKSRKIHIAIVVDEFGGTAGIVTLEDIIEEIVGDIQDEYDIEEKMIMSLGNDVLIADARVTIRDLEEHINLEFPQEGDFDTLGGFITALTGSVPKKNTRMEWQDYEFLIIEADQRRVRRVKISKISPPEKGPADAK